MLIFFGFIADGGRLFMRDKGHNNPFLFVVTIQDAVY